MVMRKGTLPIVLLVISLVAQVLPVPAPLAADTPAARGAGDLPEVLHVCSALLPAVPPPELEWAAAAVLLDHQTGSILYSFNGDEPRVPASLTKLVAIYTALDAAASGEFDLDRPYPVSPSAFASAVPPGSSLMFLGPDQMVNGWDLLRGLAVSSGNDAAVEVALRVSGSVGAFSNRMNRTLSALGLNEMFFEEPAGLSPGNRITARQMAQFSGILLEEWPQTIEELFMLPAFTYPLAVHFPNGVLQGRSIMQENRNLLLREYPGAEGLKTGFTSAAGYNLAASAHRDGRRLIAVILGVEGSNHLEGGRRRSADATALLDWGFEMFETVTPGIPALQDRPVWGGAGESFPVLADEPTAVVLPVSALELLRGEVELYTDQWAPLSAGEEVGTIRYLVGDCLIQTVSVRAATDVAAGSLFRRGVDWVRWQTQLLLQRSGED